MKPANFAPAYVGMYPELAEVARDHGYAMAVHGSLARDFDLICVPWVEKPSDPDKVVSELEKRFALRRACAPEVRDHGREVYSLIVSFGECFLDLSFTPRIKLGRELSNKDSTN